MSNALSINKPRALRGLDDELGPALPLSRVDAESLIENVVNRALEPEKNPRMQRLKLRTLSVAAIVVVTSAAAATVVHQEFRRNVSVSSPAVPVPQRQTNQGKHTHAPSSAKNQSSVQSTPSADSRPNPEVAPSSQARLPVRERTAPPINASSALLPAQEAAVVDELSAANDLRRSGQWQAAEVAYRRIAAHYPRAPQASVAQLAAAELRLEHLGDAAGALQAYQSVPLNSALGVEALFGVSRANRALQNSAAEAAALRSLLETYPTSLQADAARKRLKQLSAPREDP